jgi:hypothetical protein
MVLNLEITANLRSVKETQPLWPGMGNQAAPFNTAWENP